MSFGELWRRFVFLFRRERFRADLEEEMRIHQALRTQANRDSGMAPAAAAAASRQSFGNVGAVQDASQDAWGARWIDALRQDVRYAVRTLRKSPGFTIIAVLTLAVGIASTTAMFAVVNSVLLRKLPVRAQDRVMVMWTEDRTSHFAHWPFTYGAFTALRDQRGAFESLAGIDYNGAWSMPAELGDATTTLRGGVIAGDFFGVLGVHPLLGRVLSAEDDVVGGPRVLVISYALWRRAFGADPHVLGKSLRVIGVSYSIVGVLPQGFEYPRGADLWTTLALMVPEWERNPTQPTLDLVGRLRAGATPADALGEANRTLQHVVRDGGDWRAVQRSFTDVIVGDVRREIIVLFTAALLVLLLASVNVGGLLLVRGGARMREFAIRSALGAGQARVVRQLLTESLVLAAIGGTAGALLAAWAVQVFPGVAPPELPRADELRIDATVLAFAFAASLVAAVVCGLAPARGVWRADLSQVLRAGTQPLAASSWRRVAVVGQIALALLVVAGAGLLTRSLLLLSRVDMGFATDRLLFVRPTIPPTKYVSPQQVRDIVDRLVPSVRTLPGVVRVTAVSHLPLSLTGGIDMPFSAEGQERRAADANPILSYIPTQPEYFRTVGLAIRRGRGFSQQDRAGSPLVVVVSEAVARHTWPAQDPIGKRIRLGPADSPDPWRTVVGVAADTRYAGLLNVRASVYVPDLQPPSADGVWVPTILAIRSRSTEQDLLPSIRTAIKEVDPDVTVMSAATMNELLGRELARPRFNTGLLDVLAALALVLAVTGLYGVMGTHVAQRTREMGIRMALGADGARVARQVMWQGMQLAFAGVAAGLVAALVGTRLLASLLFGVTPADPLTLVSATVLLLLAALGASYLPVRRATRVDPMVALRYE
jgi:putative ABC transport system permease protein